MLLLFKINHISQQWFQTPLTGQSRFFQSTGFCSTCTKQRFVFLTIYGISVSIELTYNTYVLS